MSTPSTNALLLLQSATELRERLSGELASVHGLSVNDFLLMLQLEQVPDHGLPRTELAKRMRVSASTVTRMAAPMEKVGLVERRANQRDARQALVVLSAAGRTRLEEAKLTFARRADVVFADRWSKEELAALTGLLTRLVSGDVLDA